MSEREEIFFNRAERVLESLEKTKTWYKSAAMAFSISFIICVFSAGAIGYKFGLMEKTLSSKASIDSVKMLKESTEGLSSVLIKLIDDPDHKSVATELDAKYKLMNDNIFFYTTTRSGTTFKDNVK